MTGSSPGVGLRAGLRGSPEPIAALNRIRIQEYALPWPEREPMVDIRTYCPGVLIVNQICSLSSRASRRYAEITRRRCCPRDAALRSARHSERSACRRGDRGSVSRADAGRASPPGPSPPFDAPPTVLFAPYDQKAPPGHCTGGAVDVILCDQDGKPVDVTSPTQGWEAAYTWSDKPAPESRENRMVMVEAMLAADFELPRRVLALFVGRFRLAVRVGEFECPYGWSHPPVCLETDFPEAAADNLAIKTVRDFNGRAVEAAGSCTVLAVATGQGSQVFRVGLYWARGVPVTLNVAWPAGLPDTALFAGPALDALEPVTGTEGVDGGSIVRLVPANDRIVVTNHPSLPKEEKA